ncbi:hypothetical protein AKJ16_DCAP24183 [Drosera capensis]
MRFMSDDHFVILNHPVHEFTFCCIVQTMLTPQDLSFVGYTFKNFEAVQKLHDPLDRKRSTSPTRRSTDCALGPSLVHTSIKIDDDDLEGGLLSVRSQ